MPRTLLRIVALFIALWLPLQGYAAVSELLCLPAPQNTADEAMAMDHALKGHSRTHDCCATAAAAEPAAAEEADSAEAHHTASSCCQACVGTALVEGIAVSPSHAPLAQAAFEPSSPLPLFIDAPQRPPRKHPELGAVVRRPLVHQGSRR